MHPAHILQFFVWICASIVALRTAPTLPTGARRLPTVSVSLSADLAARVRQRAWAKGVSCSHVMREAIELALATWGSAEPAHEPDDEPPERRLVPWPPRAARRRAARGGVAPVE